MIENTTPGRAYSWPLYQGTKQLKAEPMDKAAYCALRGWAVPADEDPAEAGYVVEYQDGGKPNVDGFAGYISWSPADVFEQTYRPCGSHVDRMKIELAELQERTTKLDDFMQSSPVFKGLTDEEQLLLNSQRAAMAGYGSVLLMRLTKAAANG